MMTANTVKPISMLSSLEHNKQEHHKQLLY